MVDVRTQYTYNSKSSIYNFIPGRINVARGPRHIYVYVYVSLIVLVYLCKLFYASFSVFTIIFTIACPTVAIKSLFSIRNFAVDTCTPKRTYFFSLRST